MRNWARFFRPSEYSDEGAKQENGSGTGKESNPIPNSTPKDRVDRYNEQFGAGEKKPWFKDSSDEFIKNADEVQAIRDQLKGPASRAESGADEHLDLHDKMVEEFVEKTHKEEDDLEWAGEGKYYRNKPDWSKQKPSNKANPITPRDVDGALEAGDKYNEIFEDPERGH